MKTSPPIFNVAAVSETTQNTLSKIFGDIMGGDFNVSIEETKGRDIEFLINHNLTLTSKLTISWSGSDKIFAYSVVIPHEGVFVVRSSDNNRSNLYYWQPLLIEKPGLRIMRKYDKSKPSLWLRKIINNRTGFYWETPIEKNGKNFSKKDLEKWEREIHNIELATNQIFISDKERKKEVDKFVKQAKQYRSGKAAYSTSKIVDEYDIQHKRLLTFSSFFIDTFVNSIFSQIIKEKNARKKSILTKGDFQKILSAFDSREKLSQPLQEKLWHTIIKRSNHLGSSLFYLKQLRDRGRLKLFNPLNNIDAISLLMSFQHSQTKYLTTLSRQIHKSYKGIIDPIETQESDDVGNTAHLVRGVVTDVYGEIYKENNQETYLGYGTSLIPFYQHNDSVRVMMGAKNLRQALPIRGREEPWVKTGSEESILEMVKPLTQVKIVSESFSKYEPGVQLLIAYMPWYGLNFEDAVVANSRLRDEGIMTYDKVEEYSVYIKPGARFCQPKIDTSYFSFQDKNQYNLLKPGTPISQGEPIAYIIYQKEVMPIIHDGVTGILTKIKYHNPGDEGFGGLLEWTVKATKSLEVGSKLMGRYGNKGVISTLLPDEKMPKLPEDERLPENLRGKAVDLVLNPNGVISRMNLGQLIETHYGLAKALGHDIPEFAGKAFEKIDADKLSEMVTVDGVIDEYGRAKLKLPNGNLTDNPVVIGYQYITCLNHIPSNKAHVRRGRHKKDSYNLVTGQPSAGKRQKGGQRIGEMEMWALFAHQADEIIKEILTEKSIGPGASGDSINETYQAILDLLFALGVKYENNSFLPLSNREIVSRGLKVTSSKTREKYYIGRYLCSHPKCELYKFDRQQLLSFNKPTRSGKMFLTVRDLTHNFGYKLIHVDNENPTPEILKIINSDGKSDEIKLSYTIKKTIAKANFTFNGNKYIAGEKTDKVKPGDPLPKIFSWKIKCDEHTSKDLTAHCHQEDYHRCEGGLMDPKIFGDMQDKNRLRWGYIELPFSVNRYASGHKIETIPVLPMKYRYLSSILLTKMNVEHKITRQYQRLIKGIGKHKSGTKGDDHIIRPVEEIFKMIEELLLGPSNRSKHGLVRRHGLGRRVDYSGRLVIVPDPDLGWGECSIPADFFGVLYGEKIAEWVNDDRRNVNYNRLLNILFEADYQIDEVHKILKDNKIFGKEFWKRFVNIKVSEKRKNGGSEELILKLLHDFILDSAGLKVLLNRAPTLHKYNVMSFHPKVHTSRDKVLKINPLICKAFGADFDGDEMSIHALLGEEALKEAERLSPTHPSNRISVANSAPMLNFDQDFVLGYYLNEGLDKNAGLKKIQGLSNDKTLEVMRDSFKKATESGISFGYLELLKCTLDKGVADDIVASKLPVELNKELEELTNAQLNEVAKSNNNPGYGFAVLAVSGARGKKQTRQVLASRGSLLPGAISFNADDKDFIITESLVNGMSEESSFFATMNGRNSMVDKNTSPGKSGALMRKLVLALWPWTIIEGNCGEGSIEKCLRRAKKTLCAGCYGSVDGFSKLPDQYPAGLLAAQSIGERGTQLSMESFHTGESTVTIDTLSTKLNIGDESLKEFIYRLKNEPAYMTLNDRHFELLYVAYKTTNTKTLDTLWKVSRSTLSALAGPSAKGFLKNLKSGQQSIPQDILIKGGI